MRRATAMLVLLGAMILAVVLAGRQWQRRSAGAHVERAAAGLRANVGEVRFQNVAFKAALAELGERAGLRIVPRWDVLGRTGIGPETTISLDVPRGSARATLNDLLD